MPEPLIIIPGDLDQQRGYRITKWAGQYDNYECLSCQYATLWLERIQKHLQEGVHVWAYPVPEPPEGMKPPSSSDPSY